MEILEVFWLFLNLMSYKTFATKNVFEKFIDKLSSLTQHIFLFVQLFETSERLKH